MEEKSDFTAHLEYENSEKNTILICIAVCICNILKD